MSKIMKSTPLDALLERMAGEYRAKSSIFEIPERVFRENFELEASSPGLEVMGGRASIPVGPAAGPHSQIAPNLVAAYLAGSRAFELKTVQENDSLDVEKPCIDALDEGHNVEWSTELSLADAREEYLRGWIAVNLLAALYSATPRDFFFNVSVGYTLEGIKSGKVDAYLEGMRSPARGDYWIKALGDLDRFVRGESFKASFGTEAVGKAKSLLAAFPSAPVHSVTLSTMHGCPPSEIERIGRYLIEEKGFDVYVKLNPTLLGYDEARGILDETGWKDIALKRESFERDLQWKDALSLIASLKGSADAKGKRFGIKLSNTLANANDGARLPGVERYMSGRALFPITVRLAAELASALPNFGQRFSYCGGVQSLNAYELIEAGLGPLTIATDVLKPGGYLRFGPTARAAVAAIASSSHVPDPARLARLADEALQRPEYRKGFKKSNSHIARALPLFDCFSAPCMEACPTHQKVPEYLRLASRGAMADLAKAEEAAPDAAGEPGTEDKACPWSEAMATITADNPLPRITGLLCDHACEYACSRLDYEGSVRIRDVKLACSRARQRKAPLARGAAFEGKVAVVGAGPAGLSCANYLALAGVPVTVFEAGPRPGGVPANVIPRFRISREDLDSDIDFIASLGVEFRFGTVVPGLPFLEGMGFTAVFVGTGAPSERSLELKGSGPRRIGALSFLGQCSAADAEGRASPFAGLHFVTVAGGGNTAIDAARCALRIPGVKEVRLAYRRTRAEMPADAEELEAALAEGAIFEELALPEAAKDGAKPSLILRRMRLGEKDSSGRRRPEPSDKITEVPCDLLVEAIGEAPDAALLERFGIEVGRNGRPLLDPATGQALPIQAGRAKVYAGGDAARGPESIIAACADGKRAAQAILAEAGVEFETLNYDAPLPEEATLAARGKIAFSVEDRDCPDFVIREAERCLECDSACLRCVEVCPNRANIALPTAGIAPFGQAFQILHVDRLCNECGNCGFFCPYDGEPFRGKPSLFADKAALEASHNAGFAIVAPQTKGQGDSRPRLYSRDYPDGPVNGASWEEWALGDGAPMAALAGLVLKDHPYLLGGKA
jgi:putative selenate reductase